MSARALRIVCFGDSTTAPREGVEIYSVQLTRHFPNSAFINRGRTGDDTHMAMRRFSSDVLEAKPDGVVIQFGINDAAIDVWKNPPASNPRVSLESYANNLQEFGGAVRNVGSRVFLMTPNQVRWTDALRSLYGKKPYRHEEEKGFTHILELYAEKMRNVAQENAFPLLDIYSLYDEWEASRNRSCSALLLDGMHPNTDGHLLVAEQLISAIRNHFDL